MCVGGRFVGKRIVISGCAGGYLARVGMAGLSDLMTFSARTAVSVVVNCHTPLVMHKAGGDDAPDGSDAIVSISDITAAWVGASPFKVV